MMLACILPNEFIFEVKFAHMRCDLLNYRFGSTCSICYKRRWYSMLLMVNLQ